MRITGRLQKVRVMGELRSGSGNFRCRGGFVRFLLGYRIEGLVMRGRGMFDSMVIRIFFLRYRV